MRAFLSHSSKDKAFVNDVARALGGANLELDEVTFQHGLTNAEAIFKAVERFDLFVVFFSRSSISSAYIKYELRLADELYAKGLINKFLLISMDENAFREIPEEWKRFNIVRKIASPKMASRAILNALMEQRSISSKRTDYFVGRDQELASAKDRIIDPSLPQPRRFYNWEFGDWKANLRPATV
jgi:hypothetical protein